MYGLNVVPGAGMPDAHILDACKFYNVFTTAQTCNILSSERKFHCVDGFKSKKNV